MSLTYTIFVVQFLWALLLTALAIFKIVQSFEQYTIHLTNWSWTIQALFYLLSLFAFVPESLGFGSCIVATLLLPMHAIIWAVAISVQVLLLYDDDFLVTLFSKHEEGLVIFGNDVFHIWPIIAVISYLALNFATVYYSLNRMFTYARGSAYKTFVVVYLLIVGPLFIFALYLLTLLAYDTSIAQVYDTDISTGIAVLGFIGVSIVANGILLVIWLCCYGIDRRSLFGAFNQRRLFTTDYDVFLEAQKTVTSTKAGPVQLRF